MSFLTGIGLDILYLLQAVIYANLKLKFGCKYDQLNLGMSLKHHQSSSTDGGQSWMLQRMASQNDIALFSAAISHELRTVWGQFLEHRGALTRYLHHSENVFNFFSPYREEDVMTSWSPPHSLRELFVFIKKNAKHSLYGGVVLSEQPPVFSV